MLGAPPAFVLSQDQTLSILKVVIVFLEIYNQNLRVRYFQIADQLLGRQSDGCWLFSFQGSQSLILSPEATSVKCARHQTFVFSGRIIILSDPLPTVNHLVIIFTGRFKPLEWARIYFTRFAFRCQPPLDDFLFGPRLSYLRDSSLTQSGSERQPLSGKLAETLCFRVFPPPVPWACNHYTGSFEEMSTETNNILIIFS